MERTNDGWKANDERRMSNDERNPNDEIPKFSSSSLGLLSSLVIDHSSLLFRLALVVVAMAFPAFAMGESAATNSLRLILAPVSGGTASPTNIFLRITFENNGSQKLRLLAEFDPLPVFVTFNIVCEDGTPLADLPGGGKVDFPARQLRYVELEKNEFFGIQIDLATFLTTPLREGRYQISATYHNQYGENCFQGSVSSPPISVTVKNRS